MPSSIFFIACNSALFGLGLLIGWILRGMRAYQALETARIKAEEQFQHIVTANLTQQQEQARWADVMTAQFRNVATEILEEKTRQFGEKNQEQLGQVLSPFKENLEFFRKRTEEIHTSQIAQSGSLRQQLDQLSLLNNQLSKDAQNLASALKGKSQLRGAWGELILTRTLELSGLERGREFELQVSTESRLRPDAVIYLPEDRMMIVDSKVSLVDYERFCNAPEEKERAQALLRHAAAVRTHIKSLSDKGYPNLFPGKTPEMTMMFLPIESSLSAALTGDPDLLEFAFSHRIILVTPNTCLAVLRTIAHFWKTEKQTKNVLEIARLGGILHDRFVDFANYLLTARAQLTKALTTQDEALARLSSQKGNLITTAQRLHQLGAKAEKKMPPELLKEIE